MTSLNISLPEPMRAWIDEKVAKGGYATPSELVRELIRDAQRRDAQDKLESLVLEGVDSGPAFEMTEQCWEQLRARVANRLAKQQEKRP